MRRWLPWALLAASLSANVAVGVLAVHRRHGAPSGEPLLFARLELDPDQRARIAQLRSRLMSERQQHGQAMAKMRGRLGGAILHQEKDPAAVGRILSEIAGAQATYQRDVADHVLAVRHVLRPDQRAGFERMLSQHLGANGTAACAYGPLPRGEFPDER